MHTPFTFPALAHLHRLQAPRPSPPPRQSNPQNWGHDHQRPAAAGSGEQTARGCRLRLAVGNFASSMMRKRDNLAPEGLRAPAHALHEPPAAFAGPRPGRAQPRPGIEARRVSRVHSMVSIACEAGDETRGDGTAAGLCAWAEMRHGWWARRAGAPTTEGCRTKDDAGLGRHRPQSSLSRLETLCIPHLCHSLRVRKPLPLQHTIGNFEGGDSTMPRSSGRSSAATPRGRRLAQAW